MIDLNVEKKKASFEERVKQFKLAPGYRDLHKKFGLKCKKCGCKEVSTCIVLFEKPFKKTKTKRKIGLDNVCLGLVCLKCNEKITLPFNLKDVFQNMEKYMNKKQGRNKVNA